MPATTLVRWFRKAAPCSGGADGDGWTFRAADVSPALRTRLLVLQPTPFCNLDCDYCYLPDRSLKARMTFGTVRRLAERLIEDSLLGPRLDIVWHAGEPMVLPPAWYDEALSILAALLGPHCGLTHSLQTNATLVTDAWCDLIRRWDIRVGVSVDGPLRLHDAHRKTRRGIGTHGRVRAGLARLRDAGIGVHAIAVVTRATLAQPDAFLDFFEEEGIDRIGCNFDEAEGSHLTSSLAGHEDAHATFLERLLARTWGTWGIDGKPAVRELLTARQLLADPLPQYRWRDRRWPDNVQVLPFSLVTVAYDGRFSTFSPELLGQSAGDFDDFVFGNVADGGYLAAVETRSFQQAWAAIARGVAACEADCAHFAFCGGGAPANKLYELGDLAGTETLYCRTMVKRPFDAVLARLESDLALVEHDPIGTASARRSTA